MPSQQAKLDRQSVAIVSTAASDGHPPTPLACTIMHDPPMHGGWSDLSKTAPEGLLMTDGLSESLDYEPVQNRAYLAALQEATRRRFYGMIQRSHSPHLTPPIPPHVPACAEYAPRGLPANRACCVSAVHRTGRHGSRQGQSFTRCNSTALLVLGRRIPSAMAGRRSPQWLHRLHAALIIVDSNCLRPGYTGRTVAKFFSTLTAGVAIGLVAVALGSTTELLIWHKKCAATC